MLARCAICEYVLFGTVTCFVGAAVVHPLNAQQPAVVFLETKLKTIVERVGPLVKAMAVEDLARELEEARELSAVKLDEDGQVIAMSELLRVISTTEGGQAEPILQTATPFAEELVAYAPKVPTPPSLLKAQLLAFFEILDRTTFAGPEANTQRETRVRELIAIWDRAERTWASYADLDPEALARGESDPPMPAFPKSLWGIVIPGMGPEAVEDPRLRREYEAYLAERQDIHERIIHAFAVTDLRERYARQLRRYLKLIYGNNPTESAELQRILAEVIHDTSREQDIVKLINGASE